MNRDRDADCWENEYSRKGRVWGGAVHHLPPLECGMRVLELGCGNGKTSLSLLERGCDLVGIDLSASAVSLCRSPASRCPGGQFALADARSLPFTDASFDAVAAFHVIGHLTAEGRARCAQEAARVIGAGGILYFSGFSGEDFRAGTGRETEPGSFERKNGIATHYFSEDEVLALFPGLKASGCTTRRWTMTVRGRPLPRAEISATFTKTP
jgi:SAM-dependent methyltransferase